MVAAFLVGGVTGWLARGDGDTTVVAAPGPTVAPTPEGAPPAAEMAALLSAGRKLTFHVRYATQKDGSTAELELWNSPPKARRDVIAVTTKGRGHSAEIRLEEQIIRCVEVPNVPWQCTLNPVDPVKDPGDLTLGAIDPLAGSETTVRDDRILEHPVRCFTIVPPADTNALRQELCLTADGVPLKVDGGDGPVVATLFERTVDGSAFTPPAKPLGSS